MSGTLTERLLDALPQTQCTRCGYPDCAGYAAALADGSAAIDRCPPGGADGVRRLAALLGRDERPLNPECGSEGPRTLAVIDEAWCIGCTRCLEVCPTDAILGFHKRMHTVIETHCTGCELCVPVCPVDCIALEVVTPGLSGWAAWSQTQADDARRRYTARQRRIAPPENEQQPVAGVARPAAVDALPAANNSAETTETRKRQIVEAALARARAGRVPRADAP
ncbi:electron transport complex protein RnfB [Pseudacidovorax intermedius]|uniref:Electron transport complex protein RnfB n=1 Tax=Pseudacidovorax intermedius TaxID=433924 RepID=A0A370FBT7_9BURK|nr:RnfABCDGE type electron transport complex subunit B [Pseudacidovorax intermedius]RDI20098.1 electron transport complex protein RnfB [Pseudacidovorax intermedius]